MSVWFQSSYTYPTTQFPFTHTVIPLALNLEPDTLFQGKSRTEEDAGAFCSKMLYFRSSCLTHGRLSGLVGKMNEFCIGRLCSFLAVSYSIHLQLFSQMFMACKLKAINPPKKMLIFIGIQHFPCDSKGLGPLAPSPGSRWDCRSGWEVHSRPLWALSCAWHSPVYGPREQMQSCCLGRALSKAAVGSFRHRWADPPPRWEYKSGSLIFFHKRSPLM